ncbi:MAG: hypothetical protein MR959_06050 [Selenomonas bovis]|nr:hypothetical protein [Selenomonas bovis]
MEKMATRPTFFGYFISYGFIIFDKIDFVKYNFEKIIDEKILGSADSMNCPGFARCAVCA